MFNLGGIYVPLSVFLEGVYFSLLGIEGSFDDYVKVKYNKPGNVYIGLVHRLDRPVGGVMVFAKTKKSAAHISKQIQENTFKKTYLAIADGIIEKKQGIYKDLLFKDSKKNRSYVVKRVRKGVREASLEYEIIKQMESKSMVQVLLHTGRTHQIRVQFASRNMPLVGERKYSELDDPCEIALWSYRIAFAHPKTGEKMEFTHQPPETYPWTEV